MRGGESTPVPEPPQDPKEGRKRRRGKEGGGAE